MSDFFRNLASRVSAKESAVRPRIAGRYELPEPGEQLVEVVEEIDPAENEAPSLAAPLPWPVTPQEIRTGQRLEPDTQQQNGEPRDAALTRPTTSRPPDAGQSRPALTIEGAHGKISTQPAQLELGRDPPREEASKSEESPTREPTASSSPPVSTTSVRSTLSSLVFKTAMASPRAGPARERPANRFPAQSVLGQAATETVVQVSIGRVELRAPPAAIPPKRDQPTSPVSTLAEYLKQHATRSRP
jgi:hypothetical protein